MKKIISVLLVLCMAMACVLSFTPAVYAEGDFGIGFGNVEITGAIGDQFTLILKATNNPGFAASQPQLTYDRDCLRLVSTPVKIADIMYFTPSGKLDWYPFQLGIADTDNLYDEDLISCTFEILDGGKDTAAINVSAGGTTKTWKGVELFPTFSGATIHITGAAPAYKTPDVSDLDNVWYGDDGEGSFAWGYDGDDEITEMVFPANLPVIDYAYGFYGATKVTFPAKTEELGEGALVDAANGCADYYIFNSSMVIGDMSIGYMEQTWKEKGKNKTDILAVTDDSHGQNTLDELFIHGWTGSTAETYADENGFTFVPLEEFVPIGAQNGKDGGAVRVIARMRYCEFYQGASLAFAAVGEDDTGAAISKTFAYEVKTVYKGIKGTNNGMTFEAKSAADGYYLSALAIKNLPVFTGDGYITFTVTPTVVNDLGETVEFEAVEFTYDKDGYHA